MGKLRVTTSTQLMREIVDLLSVLTEEAKMSWGEKGLTVNVVDGSLVAILSATISDACFETYEVEPVEIGLELGKLRDLLTLAGSRPYHQVEIDYDDAVGAVNVRVGPFHWILRCLDTGSMPEPRPPEGQEYDSSATIGAEKLSRAFSGARTIFYTAYDLVNLSMDSKELRVSAAVENGEQFIARFDSGELSELVCPSPAQGTYSLQFLDPLTRKLASGLAQDVRMQFLDRCPLRLGWISNDGGARWTYYQAPRVTND